MTTPAKAVAIHKKGGSTALLKHATDEALLLRDRIKEAQSIAELAVIKNDLDLEWAAAQANNWLQAEQALSIARCRLERKAAQIIKPARPGRPKKDESQQQEQQQESVPGGNAFSPPAVRKMRSAHVGLTDAQYEDLEQRTVAAGETMSRARVQKEAVRLRHQQAQVVIEQEPGGEAPETERRSPTEILRDRVISLEGKLKTSQSDLAEAQAEAERLQTIVDGYKINPSLSKLIASLEKKLKRMTASRDEWQRKAATAQKALMAANKKLDKLANS